MTRDLYDQIEDALQARSTWETRQETFFRMRNGGVRRRSKPYPGAPDMHFPLADSLIEKLKPMYIQQVYASETIASFVSLREQTSDTTSAAAYWFDYQLKQRSNFERSIFIAIDEMLQDGFTPVKIYWDHDCKRLAFEQVDPLHLITPESTQEFNQGGGADWLVHVIHMSEAEYRANPLFKQDDDYIKTICGKGGDSRESGDNAKRQAVELREGINCSANDNEIVLWEIYNRDRKGKKITVETISPLRPFDDDEGPVRQPFTLPYNQGVFSKGYCFPFFKLRSELKSKGHYSSRGIVEINAPFETSLCKTWNTLHEWMDYFSKPQFTSTSPVPNGNNYKARPGGILPAGLSPVEPPAAPSSLREDMEFTRALSEYRTQMPDLSSSQHLTDKGSGGTVTATQINAIVGQSGQGSDMRARVFRLDLGEGLNMAWSLCLQYAVADVDKETGEPDKTSLTYIVDNEIKTLDQTAIHGDYEIVPNGSADSWNKGAEFTKFMSLYQVLQGNPYIGADEATKMLLEKVDPRLVKRLYRDPGIQEQDQMEQQAIETLLMASGFAAPIHDPDNDKVHIQTLGQALNAKLQENEPITPKFASLCLTHFGAHVAALQTKKDPMAKQIDQQIRPLIQLLGHIAQSGQGNVIPMQAAGAQLSGSPAGTAPDSPPPAPSQSDQIGDASKLMQALSSLIKAGVPITHAEVNNALQMAGMPPLSLNPVAMRQPIGATAQ